MTVTTKIKILTPLVREVAGVVFVDKDNKPIAAVPILGGWMPSDGDKISVVYQPQRQR